MLRFSVATIGVPVVERPAGERDAAAFGALEAGDHAQQRRLAAAGEPEHRGQRARPARRDRRRRAPAGARSPSTGLDRQVAHRDLAVRVSEVDSDGSADRRAAAEISDHQRRVGRGGPVGELASCRSRTALPACSRRSGAAAASRSARSRMEMNTSAKAAPRPGAISGSVTRRQTAGGRQPSERATSSRRGEAWPSRSARRRRRAAGTGSRRR